MFKINRLRVEITTINGTYGIDETFDYGVNFVSSQENTMGKSSVLEAIYYCLGFEQIIGGTKGIGSSVLTSAFKTTIIDKDKNWNVLESGAYLELFNGIRTITIYRNIISEDKDNRLINVYNGTIKKVLKNNLSSVDYYVHMPNSATNDRGFHMFLEEFLHLNIPLVSTTDGTERKIYLQMIFSAMFIEQKHGWSDLLSGMPYFGIKESKKRTIEFILGLDVFEAEKEKNKLKSIKNKIESEWKHSIDLISLEASFRENYIPKLPINPKIINDNEINNIRIYNNAGLDLDTEIYNLNDELIAYNQLKPKVIDNFEQLHKELDLNESEINELNTKFKEVVTQISFEDETINKITKSIEVLVRDIRNNKDVAKLQKLGSENGFSIEDGNCPVCHQPIQDNILDMSNNIFMNIDDNIQHLQEQKKLLEFSLVKHTEEKESLLNKKAQIERHIKTLTKLSQSIRTDLFDSVDSSDSETILIKKINIRQRIDSLKELQEQLNIFKKQISNLSDLWADYLNRKKNLPKDDYSYDDYKKISLLKDKFIKNLKLYNYSSLSDFTKIDISKETLLPTIDGFDMKFDSSASDSVRLIWAYSLSLLQVSIEKNGNHPGILIFDEPAQQSIVPEDMKQLIGSLIQIRNKAQIILAITLNSDELNEIINELDKDQYNNIIINNRAFTRIKNTTDLELLQ